jgi:hypothetical protein
MNSFLPNKTLFFYYPQIMGQNHFPRPPKLVMYFSWSKFRKQIWLPQFCFRKVLSFYLSSPSWLTSVGYSVFLYLHDFCLSFYLSLPSWLTSAGHSIFLYLHDLLLFVILSFFWFAQSKRQLSNKYEFIHLNILSN